MTLDYRDVRSLTEALAAPLSAEDQTVQSMADTSPTKWHRAHTTWFFETFVLGPHRPVYRTYDDAYGYLFNSYYDAVGERQPRDQRGMVTRPGVTEVGSYREHVDIAMEAMLKEQLEPALAFIVTLGLHHEQQHQELLLADIKHVLSRNPLRPAYGKLPFPAAEPDSGRDPFRWIAHEGGIVPIGHEGTAFAFDNEGPRHDALLQPFEIASQLVTNAEWQAFIDDGGYARPELWMSDGWYAVRGGRWEAPIYWERHDDRWQVFTLDGLQPVDPAEPVSHVSWYEADAFARWASARLPTEAEWEAAAPEPDAPSAIRDGWYGAAWQWTASPYVAYPRFQPARGAVGEYNGKFMVNTHVLRGSCWATPPGHARRTYRNFYTPVSRWCAGGVRLARDGR